MNEVANMPRSRELKGRTVLLTGASGGIGREIIPALLETGVVRIIAADRTCRPLNDARVETLALDITDPGSVAAAAAKYADAVDILINNAGHNCNTRFLDVDEPRNAEREMQVNYFGALAMVRAFAPAMQKRGTGVIVNMISVVGHVSFPNMGSYCASKAALHSMTQGIRAELGYDGVDVIGIYPPAVDTRMSSHVPASAKIAPGDVAQALVRALREGVDEIYIGMAADLYDRVRRDPKAVEAMLKGRVARAKAV